MVKTNTKGVVNSHVLYILYIAVYVLVISISHFYYCLIVFIYKATLPLNSIIQEEAGYTLESIEPIESTAFPFTAKTIKSDRFTQTWRQCGLNMPTNINIKREVGSDLSPGTF